MKTFIIILLFIGLILGIPSSIAQIVGLKYDINDKTNKTEINDVKRNILWVKLTTIYMTITIIITLIFLTI